MTQEDRSKLAQVNRTAQRLVESGERNERKIASILGDDPDCSEILRELIDRYGEAEVRRAVAEIVFPH